MKNPSQDPTKTTPDHKKRSGRGRTAVVGAAAATAALLAACSPGGGSGEATPRETTTTVAEATTTTKAAPTPEEVKTYSDAVEKNSFNERLQEAKVELATEIVDAFNNNEGDSTSNFYEFNDSEYFEAGYGALNVMFNTQTNGSGIGEYGLIAHMKRNPDGTFDPNTVDGIHVYRQVNRTGIEGPGSDRVPVESVVFNYNTMDVQAGGETTLLSDYDTSKAGDQVALIDGGLAKAHEIIQAARAGEPVNL